MRRAALPRFCHHPMKDKARVKNQYFDVGYTDAFSPINYIYYTYWFFESNLGSLLLAKNEKAKKVKKCYNFRYGGISNGIIRIILKALRIIRIILDYSNSGILLYKKLSRNPGSLIDITVY